MFRRIVLPFLLIIGLPRAACSEATVDLSWNQCSPVVAATMADPNQPVATLYVTATGWTEPHEGYVLRLWIGVEMPCRSIITEKPDAWRFDAAGCNAGRLETFLAFASKTCPPAVPTTAGPWNGHFLSYVADPLAYQTGSLRFAAFRYYATQVPDPATRYLLVGIRFDHSLSTTGPGTPGVSCGGLETPICAAMWPEQWPFPGIPNCQPNPEVYSYFVRSSDHAEIPFRQGQGWASFNVTGSFGCFQATPARDATWGSIKGQYR